MWRPTRRRVLQASGVVALGALAGCSAMADQAATNPQEDPTETTVDGDSLTDWERSTDCEGKYDGMHDSVIKVQQVTTSLGNAYDPIHFSNLSTEEQSILRTVTEEGGYRTCDTSDAFQAFVERVSEHRQRQAETRRVYLKREEIYYGLYVEKLDQVYSS
jgi:hypothetical protein